MDQASLERALQEVFRLVLDSDVTPAISRADESKWDSLKHMQLVFAVEERFDVQFTEAEIAQLNSFTQFVEFLQRHRAT